jgi:hypothetical protein
MENSVRGENRGWRMENGEESMSYPLSSILASTAILDPLFAILALKTLT